MEPNGKTQLAVRRSPFPEFDELRDDIRTIFDTRWPFTLTPSRLPLGFERQPAVDMFERDGNVVVKAAMPGIAPESVDVSQHRQHGRHTRRHRASVVVALDTAPGGRASSVLSRRYLRSDDR